MNFKMHLQLFLRSFFLQTSWNYVKYQNIGLTFVMWPFLKQLYKDKPSELPSVLERYLEAFNTQPMMASFCFGALAKQEERLLEHQSLEELELNLAEWDATRRSLSITTASIGDRLFWGALKPLTLLLALFICLFLGINFFEPEMIQTVPSAYIVAAIAAAFICFNAVALFVKWIGISLGYNSTEKACFGLINFDWNKTIYHAKRIGVFFTIALLLFGAYHFLKDLDYINNVHFWARLCLIITFVGCSLLARKLRVPNMYLYMAAVVIFTIVSSF